MFLQVPPTGAGFYADSSWECFGSPVSLSGRNLLRGTDYNAPPSCSPPRYAAPGGGSASLGAEQRRKPYQLRLLSATKPEVSIRWTALESAPHKGVLKAFHLRLLPVPVAGRE
jgi:hypothetical protein